MTDLDENFDPVALLGSLEPPAGWNERTDIDTDEHAASIYEKVVTGNVVPFRAPRRRLRVVTGVVVAVTVGATAVAALWERSPDEARNITCWSEAVSPPQAQIEREWDGISDPVAGCAPEWNSGGLGVSGPPGELRVCVTDTGLAAVIPGEDGTCEALGLAEYTGPDPADETDDGTTTDPLDIAAAEERISQNFNPLTCVTAQEAAEGVDEILDELGFVGWAIEIGGAPSVDEPCATVALDTELNTAWIRFSRRAD